MNSQNPFPLQITAKVNSPELEAYLAQFGSQSYYSADEINIITEALNFLYEHTNEGVTLTQNNFVRKIRINENLLQQSGTIEEKLCAYILALPEEKRTILDTDSAWIIETFIEPLPPVINPPQVEESII